MGQLRKIDKFPEIYYLIRLNHEDTDLNRSIASKELN